MFCLEVVGILYRNEYDSVSIKITYLMSRSIDLRDRDGTNGHFCKIIIAATN